MEYKIRIEPLAYSQILEAVDFLKNVSYEAAPPGPHDPSG